nr:PDZ domain-containing protein [Rubrivivax sp.]
GVAIVQLAPGGPAARAGLQPFRRARDGGVQMGDVVTAIDGEPVKTLDDILTLLEQRQPGDKVTLTLWRAGRARQEQVTLGTSE